MMGVSRPLTVWQVAPWYFRVIISGRRVAYGIFWSLTSTPMPSQYWATASQASTSAGAPRMAGVSVMLKPLG